MPLFDYVCDRCGAERIDHRVHSHTQDVTLPCACGGTLTRQISRTSFYLKGAGWASGGYVKEVTRQHGVTTTVEGDTRVLTGR